MEQGLPFLSIAKEIKMLLEMPEQKCTSCCVMRDGTVLPDEFIVGCKLVTAERLGGKPVGKGDYENGRACRDPSSTNKLAHGPLCCMSQWSLLPSAELKLMAALQGKLRTPCHHPNSAFMGLILPLETGLVPNRAWFWVFSSQQTQREEVCFFCTGDSYLLYRGWGSRIKIQC